MESHEATEQPFHSKLYFLPIMFAENPDNPVEIERVIRAELQQAPGPGHAWRLPVFVTRQGVRTVVLRAFDSEDNALLFYTDIRSPKVSELAESNKCSWLIYDHEQKVQLRLDGTATVHTSDELADRCWVDCPDISRVAWFTEHPPGTVVSECMKSYAADDVRQPFTGEQLQAARQRFCVVRSEIEVIDWLHLSPRGNTRLRIRYESGETEFDWLVP